MPAIVDLTALKAHVRKLDTSEDTILAAYLAAAIRYVEDYTGHVLSARSVTDVFHEWGTALRLRHQPITGTPTVEYVDANGDDQDYEGFVFRNALYPATIEPPASGEFPALGVNGSVSVSYTAGYASGEVPAALNQAVLLLAGQWYANRTAAGEELTELPFAVAALCRPYRGAVLA